LMKRSGAARARGVERARHSRRLSDTSFVIPPRSRAGDTEELQGAHQRPGPAASRPGASAPTEGGPRASSLETTLLGRVSIVIPTLNEAESIGHVLAGIPAAVGEVILVDGLSTDGTVEAARAVRPDVRVVHQTVRGKGAAIRAGVEAAKGEYIVLMDGDGSTEANQIVAFARALAGGADYVKASRFLPGAGTDDMPFHRRVGNWLFVVAARVLFGARFTDITYGYNAVRREHRDSMALEIDGWAQEIVTNVRMVRLGRRVAEIPAFEPRRIAGVAKLGTWSAGWDILRAMLVERRRPLAMLVERGGGDVPARVLVPVMEVGDAGERTSRPLSHLPRPRLVPVMDNVIAQAREHHDAFDIAAAAELTAQGVFSASPDT
jgi:hypothetical protein